MQFAFYNERIEKGGGLKLLLQQQFLIRQPFFPSINTLCFLLCKLCSLGLFFLNENFSRVCRVLNYQLFLIAKWGMS